MTAAQVPYLTVVVPGPWPSRSALVAAVRKTGAFVFAGRDLRKAGLDERFPIKVVEHDPEVAAAFAELGPAAGLTAAELHIAANHTRAAEFSFAAQGPALAAQVLEFSSAIIRAGGCGARVTSGRKVVNPRVWLQAAATNRQPASLYAAFVSLAPMPDGSRYYSVGMQAMGMPDATAPGDLSAGHASELMAAFLSKCFQQSPDLREDEMFRPQQTQHFRMNMGDCRHFPPGHPQHNPYGVWNLR